ncbi:hypothetical protein NQ317_003849 [Molorchus minor]|uniref:Pre-C2HC domain-containing protein n=1 Tax=Molorchus minor TaxID=1323400 RepID=A0ABQ9J140_9CUCU|nr:hypothetical protein NQ317_003849 [Molorchus minor]
MLQNTVQKLKLKLKEMRQKDAEIKQMMREEMLKEQEHRELLMQELTAIRAERSPAKSAEKKTAEQSADFIPAKTRSQRRKTAKRTKLDNPTSSSDSEMEIHSQPDHSHPATPTQPTTYSLQEDKKLRVVIRGLPEDLPEQEIVEDLQDQGFHPATVQRMRSRRTKNKMPLVLVQQPEGEVSILTALRQCCMLLVRVERRASQDIGQCHRCQRFGHAQGTAIREVHGSPAMCEVRRESPHHGMQEAPHDPSEVCQLRGTSSCQLQGVPQVPQEGSSEAPNSPAHIAAAHSIPKTHPAQANNIRQSNQLHPGRKRKATADQPAQSSSPPVPHQPDDPDGRDDGQNAGDICDDGSTVREAPVSSTKILSWNVNGMRTKRNDLLKSQPAWNPTSLPSRKTKMDSRHEFKMRGYRVYRQDRNIRGGGVAVLYSCKLGNPFPIFFQILNPEFFSNRKKEVIENKATSANAIKRRVKAWDDRRARKEFSKRATENKEQYKSITNELNLTEGDEVEVEGEIQELIRTAKKEEK